MRGPGPKSKGPSMSIQAWVFFKASNKRVLSTFKSRTRGNLVSGSKPMGCLRSSIRAEQAWRGVPLMIMVQAPQTSSRHTLSQTTGVVGLPWAFTGFFLISIRADTTFICGWWATLNSSQCGFALGPSCRLTMRRIGSWPAVSVFLASLLLMSFRVIAFTGRNK